MKTLADAKASKVKFALVKPRSVEALRRLKTRASIHGQDAVAPNGIELHPVLAFASTNCKRLPTPRRG